MSLHVLFERSSCFSPQKSLFTVREANVTDVQWPNGTKPNQTKPIKCWELLKGNFITNITSRQYTIHLSAHIEIFSPHVWFCGWSLMITADMGCDTCDTGSANYLQLCKFWVFAYGFKRLLHFLVHFLTFLLVFAWFTAFFAHI